MWYSSCVDLVNSRFLASEYAELGISGLRVTRVTRVHNRHLRNRFEERLEGMVNVADAGYKRSLEYLFFGEHPHLPHPCYPYYSYHPYHPYYPYYPSPYYRYPHP